MLRILCLLGILSTAENALVNLQSGIIAIEKSHEIPFHMRDNVEIDIANTILRVKDYTYSYYIGRKLNKDDPATRSLNFTFTIDQTKKCESYATNIYFYNHEVSNDEPAYLLVTLKDNILRVKTHTFLTASGLDHILVSATGHNLVLAYKDNFKNNTILPNSKTAQCQLTHADWVICQLHLTTNIEYPNCSLDIRLHEQHKILLFSPIITDDSNATNMRTRPPRVPFVPPTLEPEYSTTTEAEVVEATTTARPVVSRRHEIGLSTEWLITLLVLEIFIFTTLGAGVVFIYHKKFKKQPVPSDHHSEDEELENVIQDLNLRNAPINQTLQKRVTSPRTQPATELKHTDGPLSTKTGIAPGDKNVSQKTETLKALSAKEKRPVSPIQTAVYNASGRRSSVKPQSAVKSKKSFFQRTKDRFRLKSKSSSNKNPSPNTRVPAAKPSAGTTADSNLNYTTLNIPIGAEMRRDFKKIQKVRKQVIEELEKKKLEQQTMTQTTFVNDEGVKVYGVDAEGCEQTQRSEDDSYKAQIQDAVQAKKDAEKYEREYTPDGRQRTPAELAEYDAAKGTPKPI